jgi:maltooligosyltrehalose trehalohydrolase
MTTLLLLMPGTPMLFQGQEFAASAPFFYFADLDAELAELVRKGRREFLTQFPSVVDYSQRAPLTDPSDPATAARCVLDFGERHTHAAAYALHQDLLALRQSEAAFRTPRRGAVDGAVLSATAFALRFFSDHHLDDRLLIVNLGHDLSRASFAEPLMAPPTPDYDWTIRWSSENPVYGGGGTPAIWARDYADRAIPDASGADCYLFAGESAIVLSPCPRAPRTAPTPRRRTA